MSKPDWLTKGTWINFSLTLGHVLEICESPEHVLLLVESTQQILQNRAPEWIEFTPESFTPATYKQVQEGLSVVWRESHRLQFKIEELEEKLYEDFPDDQAA